MFSLFLFLAILIYGVETTKKLIEHGMPFGTVQWALAALVVAMFISEIFLGIKLIKQQKINKAERKVYLEEQKAIESRRRREFFMDDFSNETC
ncbi:MAG: hypothetical protein RRY38_03780, partial [Oscillospiraceae bacterium]